MKKSAILIFTCFFTLSSFSQECEQADVMIKKDNGYELFKVCKVNPALTFDAKKDYHWYYSGEVPEIRVTKGGCDGNLLNGSYQYYDSEGKLRANKNFSFGLQVGKAERWDSLGNLAEKAVYDNGLAVYYLFLNDYDQWIEFNGPVFFEGTITKIYTFDGILMMEETMLANSRQHVKAYYEQPANQVSEEFTSYAFDDGLMSGDYRSYFENGNIKVEGRFYDCDFASIKTGVWKWYNNDGTVASAETHKAEVSFWPDGKPKVAGGFILNTETDEWIKTGVWKWFDEQGNISDQKTYN